MGWGNGELKVGMDVISNIFLKEFWVRGNVRGGKEIRRGLENRGLRGGDEYVKGKR